MYDALVTAAVADELSETLVDGRIQRVGLRDRSSVVLEIYRDHRRHTLLVDLGGREPACYLSERPQSVDATLVTPLSLLMRKYLRGGWLVAVEQPPLDRVLRLSVSKAFYEDEETPDRDIDDHVGEDEPEADAHRTLIFTTLTIELMGRRSNIMLVDDDGLVLDAFKRVTPEMSRVRPILPRRPYAPPPPPDRVDPRTLTLHYLKSLLEGTDSTAPLHAVLVREVLGMSPQLAREIAYRASGTEDASIGDLTDDAVCAASEAMHAVFRSIEHSDWDPVVYLDEASEVAAYAAIPLEHLGTRYRAEQVATMSVAIERSREGDRSAGKHAARKQRLLTDIERARERLLVKIDGLRREFQEQRDADRFRRWGDAIYANLWNLSRGATSFEFDGETIPLDPDLDPKDQAQHYFERYRKAGRGVEQIQQMLVAAERDLEYVQQTAEFARMAESFDEIESVRREWESRRSRPDASDRGASRKVKPSVARGPLRLDRTAGGTILIGRSGEQNDAVTFDIAGPDDYWLHARGVPGAHVILRPGGIDDAELENALEEAASYAASFSASRSDSMVSVDICRRRDVRKIKGAGPGMVTYRNERTVRVGPRAPG
jgi:predicted ribosome quality control (RQC) complex YloA/Tae2 family protein